VRPTPPTQAAPPGCRKHTAASGRRECHAQGRQVRRLSCSASGPAFSSCSSRGCHPALVRSDPVLGLVFCGGGLASEDVPAASDPHRAGLTCQFAPGSRPPPFPQAWRGASSTQLGQLRAVRRHSHRWPRAIRPVQTAQQLQPRSRWGWINRDWQGFGGLQAAGRSPAWGFRPWRRPRPWRRSGRCRGSPLWPPHVDQGTAGQAGRFEGLPK